MRPVPSTSCCPLTVLSSGRSGPCRKHPRALKVGRELLLQDKFLRASSDWAPKDAFRAYRGLEAAHHLIETHSSTTVNVKVVKQSPPALGERLVARFDEPLFFSHVQ